MVRGKPPGRGNNVTLDGDCVLARFRKNQTSQTYRPVAFPLHLVLPQLGQTPSSINGGRRGGRRGGGWGGCTAMTDKHKHNPPPTPHPPITFSTFYPIPCSLIGASLKRSGSQPQPSYRIPSLLDGMRRKAGPNRGPAGAARRGEGHVGSAAGRGERLRARECVEGEG